MNRIPVILLAALLTAAPLSPALAQARVPDAWDQQQPRISEAEAQSMAVRRAPRGARLIGSLGYRGGQWVFRFELENGRVIDIGIPA